MKPLYDDSRLRPWRIQKMRELLPALQEMVAEMQLVPDRFEARLKRVHPENRESAVNLLQYLVLRQHDLRGIQRELAGLGLSSLGRAEAGVMESFRAVIRLINTALAAADGNAKPAEMPESDPAFLQPPCGSTRLTENTAHVLGPPQPHRNTRIMVTMPPEAAHDLALLTSLLESGMDVARINCAHDQPEDWLRMTQNLAETSRATGKNCRVMTDLAGPKIRTAEVPAEVPVLKIKPERDTLGRVTLPARIRLLPASGTAACADSGETLPALVLDDKAFNNLKPGDTLHLRDTRGARRKLLLEQTDGDGLLGLSHKTIYAAPGIRLKPGRSDQPAVLVNAVLNPDPAVVLKPGDLLEIALHPQKSASFSASPSASASTTVTAHIACSLPEAFRNALPGAPVWFDDGKIGGIIEDIAEEKVLVRIRQARPTGTKLRADKGINLPQTVIEVSALTEKDRADLPWIQHHADLVALSFVNQAEDVQHLMDVMEANAPGAKQPAIILKIETRQAFDSLPDMLLTAMQARFCGVMIARGDLAIECGFERMAEVQEEILWISEAAHVPVIWATQVLENLAKTGLPSRAEISDAAMGNRAECVMLNKGPHITAAVQSLDNILHRMEAHQTKKKALLRKLSFEDRGLA
ncbi:pyruvate kinase [Cyclonatronum proteinivorum]|uniref:pyruvate kinase n=1 Tax=Cyclonatronum proteinivorum TaxID=1457365 RepID=A0A345UN89_9BACT|nr:pyruvate kinase [Cyclonatronum proteinivorum]AXJ01941.1 pyruvate kinase [Cyclonatronum proteinivorum]